MLTDTKFVSLALDVNFELHSILSIFLLGTIHLDAYYASQN